MQKHLFHLLMHTGKLLDDRVREGLAVLGIHHGQGRVLCAIGRNGVLSQVAIANGLGIEPATVTNMIRRMEQGGLIERAPDPHDKRAINVKLTRAGKRAEEQVRKAWDAVERDIRRSIPREAIGQALALLTAIRDGLGGRDPGV